MFTDIFNTFAITGHLGGRTAAGHGRIHAAVTTHTSGTPTLDLDWRTVLAERRDDAIAALNRVS